METLFFTGQKDFRKWLEKNHKTEKEVLVGFYNAKSGIKGMTWSQAVDQALCFGWIDGVRRSIDENRYYNRFTPRRPSSNWSNINIRKVEELKAKGLMQPAGLEAFEKRKSNRSGIYSFENKPARLTASLLGKLKTNKTAWDFFSSQAPSYQRTVAFWVMSAKQEQTRLRRLGRLIKESEEHRKIY